MNDKTKSKVETKIETEELKDEALADEELENVDGGAAYMKYDGVDGESFADVKHNDWIDVLSMSGPINRNSKTGG